MLAVYYYYYYCTCTSPISAFHADARFTNDTKSTGAVSGASRQRFPAGRVILRTSKSRDVRMSRVGTYGYGTEVISGELGSGEIHLVF